MSNTNLHQQITSLKKQKAFAWAKVFEEINTRHQENRQQLSTLTKVEIPALPKCLVDEFMEMTLKLKKSVECPICFQEIIELSITGCGHKYCNECFKKIDTCAICRKKIFKN